MTETEVKFAVEYLDLLRQRTTNAGGTPDNLRGYAGKSLFSEKFMKRGGSAGNNEEDD